MRINWLLGACLVLSPVAAAAETLTVEGYYPAANGQAAQLSAIAIERLGGPEGGTLSTKIADRLRSATIDGEPWVRVIAGSIGSEADAALTGYVNIDVRETESYDKEVTTCVRRDDKRKCIEKRKESVPCVRVEGRVSPALRLVDRDGRLIHSDDSDVTREYRTCADETEPSMDPLIEEALNEIADRMRYAIAPHYKREAIRVLESRKGMEKGAGRSFRDAIRQTKDDQEGACNAFAALEETIGEHRSLLFNIGLCAEAAGDFDTAQSYYERTIAMEGDASYAKSGLLRIDSRRRADDQMGIRSEDVEGYGIDG